MKFLSIIMMLVLLVLGVSGCSSDSSKPFADFQGLCKLAQDANAKAIGVPEKLLYVRANLVDYVKSLDIREAYQSLDYVQPEERYQVFKSAAEATLGSSWSCQPLELLLGDAAKEFGSEE